MILLKNLTWFLSISCPEEEETSSDSIDEVLLRDDPMVNKPSIVEDVVKSCCSC